MKSAKKTAGKDPRESKGSSKVKEGAVAQTGGPVTQEHKHDTALSSTTDEKKARRKLADADDRVTVRIPHAFNLHVLVDGGSQMVRYEAGTDEMPRSHAEHQYAVDHGVEIVSD